MDRPRTSRVDVQAQGERLTIHSTFPIMAKWPPVNPDAIQLYSLATPNGVKVSIALEETGLAVTSTSLDEEAMSTSRIFEI